MRTPLHEQPWFEGIQRPSRYLGAEVNACRKAPESVEVAVALAYPDVYEIGMSHLGLRLLYHILNAPAWLAAERVFAPWVDLEQALRHHGLPLTTLESRRPLSHFDILGFSLQHEMCFTNVLNMLDLARIPLRAAERPGALPLVIAGGPACFNPEPVAEIFDLIVVGDGEEVFLDICQALRRAKGTRRFDKQAFLKDLRHLPGVYIPALFRPAYDGQGLVTAIEPLCPDYPHVTKAVVSDPDRYPYPTRQIVPFTELVHDRIAVEISRGCTRGCRFCQAGMIYRPVRERSPEGVLRSAREAIAATGYDELSLLSLSAGDYSCIGPLITALMDQQVVGRTALSLPSLRVESLQPLLMEQIKRVRKTGFTIAPEAGSERLRWAINKCLTNEDILRTAQAVYRAGWHLLKLYFMIGLPFETDQDLEAMVELARQVTRLAGKSGKKPKVNLALATFVPKAHTPFTWVPQVTLEESQRRVALVHEGLKGAKVGFKWNAPEVSWLDGIFARGDRRLLSAVMAAWQMGARFDAWGDQYRKDIWEAALEAARLEPHFYLYRPRGRDEVFPWEHIRSGVSREYLWQEWCRAAEGLPTPDCRVQCTQCGVCPELQVQPLIVARDMRAPARDEAADGLKDTPVRLKWRITFQKIGPARFLSHLELLRTIARALKRAAIPVTFSQGFHPLPRVSFPTALPVGMESLEEHFEIETSAAIPPLEFTRRMNQELPEGLRLLTSEMLAPGQKSGRLSATHYRVEGPEMEFRAEAVEAFLKVPSLLLPKARGKDVVHVDARRQVVELRLLDPHRIELVLRPVEGPELQPRDIIQGVFQLTTCQGPNLKVTKIKQVLA